MNTSWRSHQGRSDKYNYASFAPWIVTNYDVKANVAASFQNVWVVGYIEITTTSDITLKINSASNPAIPLTASKSLVLDVLMIDNLFVTVASGTPTITILSTF